MEAKPVNEPGMLLEGLLGFENEGLISSYSQYWMQVVRASDGKGGSRVIFRVLRDKKGQMRGQAGDLPEDAVKRQVVLGSTRGQADPEMPRSVEVTTEAGKKRMGKVQYDFSVVVNQNTKYNLRAGSEAER